MSKCLCELVLIAEWDSAYLGSDGSTDFRVIAESKQAAFTAAFKYEIEKYRGSEAGWEILAKWTGEGLSAISV